MRYRCLDHSRKKIVLPKPWRFDIDEWAFENAKENIKLNQVTGIDIRCGGVEKISANERFDLILANINRNILLKDMHAYASALNGEGGFT
jgi:ribosomal protein L11 methyltransferase